MRSQSSASSIGIIDEKSSMHYFDPTACTWRFRNDTPGFSQRITGTLSDDGTAIDGEVELSRDDGRPSNPPRNVAAAC
jgi:hypothetical protein